MLKACAVSAGSGIEEPPFLGCINTLLISLSRKGKRSSNNGRFLLWTLNYGVTDEGCFFFFFLFAVLYGLWDLISPAAVKAQSPNH